MRGKWEWNVGKFYTDLIEEPDVVFINQSIAEKSGVSLGSIKRFEQQGEISIKHLILIAFAHLFEEHPFRTTDDVIRAYQYKTRHRARPKKNP
ncbi:MAG: hypothetical protein ACO363_06755 [Balneolaceae bacterium]